MLPVACHTKFQIFAAAALAFHGAICAAASGAPEESAARLAVYQSIYPLYVEYCAHSQINKKPGFGETVVGNEWGHATVYIAGACKDMSQGYPLIRACDELPAEQRPAGANPGVGVSPDYDYQNVSWLPVPDRHFFYWGDLQPGERFTQAAYNRTEDRAKAMGLLDGVTGSDSIYANKPAGMSNEEFLWQDTFGTDFGIDLGRASSCGRVPINHAMLDQMVDFLNGLNEEAHAHGNPFNSISNNCSHTSHNALAAMGFWDSIAVNEPLPIDLFDLALPYNQFVSFMQRGTGLPLDNALLLFRDTDAVKLLGDQATLPTRDGVVSETWPAYPENDVYDTSTHPEFLEAPNPFIGNEFETFTTQAQYTDLRTELSDFEEKLKKIQANKPLNYWYYPDFPRETELNYPAFAKFFSQYYSWVDAQVTAIGKRLQALPSP